MQEPWIILDSNEKIPEILRGTQSHLQRGGVSLGITNTTKEDMLTNPYGNIIARRGLFTEKSKYVFKSL